MFTSFQNPGLIEPAAITTLGINVKESDLPIGFFGTGLKYAIASLLRTGQKITIWRGLDKIDFRLVSDEVRGKTFQFIEMLEGTSVTRLGFTADLGKQWEPWQVFRELYSNTLDEGGMVSLYEVSPKEGFTTIQVWGTAFGEAAGDRDKVFLNTPISDELSTADVFVHDHPNDFIYYKGVRVNALSKPTALTYDLKLATLTEDRTLANFGVAQLRIERAVEAIENEFTLERLLTNKDCFEATLNYYGAGEAFYGRVMSIIHRKGETSISPQLRQNVKDALKAKINYTTVNLAASETRQIEKALAFLRRIGFAVTQPIHIVANLGPGTAGLARDGQIFLSQETLTKGGNWLIGTILEEHVHIVHGFTDQSKELQNFLLDLLVKFAREARDE